MLNLKNLPHQQPDEKVILFLRRHWTVVFQIIIAIGILYFIPAFLVGLFWQRILPFFEHELYGPILTLIISLYTASIWLLAFVEFVDYYLDVWIVTNKRILNIEQKGLFRRTASELHIGAIQDVTSEVNGILRTVFDFGNVYIQTAGKDKRFIFKDIPEPEKIKEEITGIVQKLKNPPETKTTDS